MARTVNEAAYEAKRNAILDAAQLAIATKGYERMSSRYGMRLNSLFKRRVNEKHEQSQYKSIRRASVRSHRHGVILLMMPTSLWRLFDEEKFLKKISLDIRNTLRK